MLQRSRYGSTNKLIFLLVLLMTVALSCSLLNPRTDGSPAEGETQEVETPTPQPTPTETVIPTATETPLPSITPTPSYDWCKGMNTRLSKEDEIKVGPSRGDAAFAAYVCVVEVVGLIREFPEPAIGVRIGFNDVNGNLHIYSAVIGGLIGKKAELGGFSYPACYSQSPPMLSLDEYIEKLKIYTSLESEAKEFPILIHTQLGYESHWPPEASLVNRYEEINAVLKTAVETGDGFPEAPEKYRIFILPGLEPCQ